MILHTLNQAPSNRACMESCLESISSDDTLLLIEDGVYWSQPAFRDTLDKRGIKLFALAPDIKARGVDVAEHEQIDDLGFVQLCTSHDKVVSWF